MDNELIEVAYELAKKAHDNQWREDGKTPYIKHIEAVVKRVKEYAGHTDITIAAAYLHDTIEDTWMTSRRLKQYGIPQEVIDVVVNLTRKKNENYFAYIIKIKHLSNNERIIKLADLEHNMSGNKKGSRQDKYRFAHFFLSQKHIGWYCPECKEIIPKHKDEYNCSCCYNTLQVSLSIEKVEKIKDNWKKIYT